MKVSHDWTIHVEYRQQLINLDTLFYKWLRCELVHAAELPNDLRVDDRLGAPGELVVRAGGEPDNVLLLSEGWYHHLVRTVERSLETHDVALGAVDTT